MIKQLVVWLRFCRGNSLSIISSLCFSSWTPFVSGGHPLFSSRRKWSMTTLSHHSLVLSVYNSPLHTYILFYSLTFLRWWLSAHVTYVQLGISISLERVSINFSEGHALLYVLTSITLVMLSTWLMCNVKKQIYLIVNSNADIIYIRYLMLSMVYFGLSIWK